MRKTSKLICFVLTFCLIYSVIGVDLASARISGEFNFTFKLTGGKLVALIVPITMVGLVILSLVGLGKQEKSNRREVSRYFSQNPSRISFKKHVLAGAIVEDMHKDEVLLSWGSPQETYLDVDDSHYTEVWIYPDYHLGFEGDWLVARILATE